MRCTWARSRTRPAPTDGCLLRVTACGICGTDVRTFFNGDRRIQPGAVLGHEICGEVLEIGPDAGADLAAAVGDTVHVISTLYCGHCSLCRGGNEHLCQNGGLMGFDYQGAYTELVAVPQVALKNVFVLPDGLDSVHATFADPLSDAICGHKDLDIGLEQHVVVIGAGPVGTAHVALALAQGADLVYLLETSAGRLDLARGVLNDANVRYVDTTGIDPVQFIKDETGDGADRVIVACSNVQAQEQAMEMAAPRGPGAVLRRAAQGHDHDRLPLQRAALPRGGGARQLRLATPRPGAGAGDAAPQHPQHPRGRLGCRLAGRHPGGLSAHPLG